ncbi:MAG: tetratricopeptide repeat protein [Pelovirga sp.]
MSLINDMLRDLEERRNKEVQQQTASTPAAVKHNKTKRLLLIIGAGFFTVLIALLVTGWLYFPAYQVSEPMAAVEVSSQGVARADPEPVVPTLSGVPPAAQPAPLTRDSQPLLSEVILREESEQLLLELVFNQLPDTAEIRPLPQEGRVSILLQNTHIRQGLVMPQPQTEKVSAISLLPGPAGLELSVATGSQQQITTTQKLEPGTERLYIGLRFAPAPATKQGAQKNAAATVSPTPAAAVPEVPAATKQEQKIPSSPALVRHAPQVQSEEELYQRGLQQLRQGDLPGAREYFAKVLQLDPQRLPARLELVSVLQQLGAEQEALMLINEGLQYHPLQPDLRKLYAHHLIFLQDYREGLALLEKTPLPAFTADPDYHALRAAAYQELGEYPRAAEVYVRLLELRPHQALWWLGLAIALEQQGQTGGARDAYQTALDVSGLRPDLEKFIRERLQHL